jgi:hypothetical protein
MIKTLFTTKNSLNLSLFLFLFLSYSFNLTTFISFPQLKTDLANGYILSKTQPAISQTSENLTKMGLQTNDIILSINNIPTEDQGIIKEQFALNRGKEITITFSRDNTVQTMTALVPSDFEAFGYGNDLALQDKKKVEKNSLEIIIHNWLYPPFEEQFSNTFNINMRLNRMSTYVASLIMMFVSIGFLFRKQVSWYIASLLILVTIIFSFNQGLAIRTTPKFLTLVINLWVLITLIYSYKINFSFQQLKNIFSKLNQVRKT